VIHIIFIVGQLLFLSISGSTEFLPKQDSKRTHVFAKTGSVRRLEHDILQTWTAMELESMCTCKGESFHNMGHRTHGLFVRNYICVSMPHLIVVTVTAK
jgi:hypothetical protein